MRNAGGVFERGEPAGGGGGGGVDGAAGGCGGSRGGAENGADGCGDGGEAARGGLARAAAFTWRAAAEAVLRVYGGGA